jgi:hypothetical protein
MRREEQKRRYNEDPGGRLVRMRNSGAERRPEHGKDIAANIKCRIYRFLQKSCKCLARFERFRTPPPFGRIKKLYIIIEKSSLETPTS